MGTAVVIGAAAVLAAGAVAASLASDAPPEARLRFALLNALIILVPVGVGLYASRYEAHRRFGRQLIAAGLVWSTAALAQADASVPYSIGRIGGWTVTVVVICLVLAYPTGRLTRRLDRGLAAAALAVGCLLFLPTALLIDSYPTQTPWSSCRHDCPANTFMLVDEQPAFLDAWLYPLRDAILVALFLGVLATVAARMRRATYLQRRTLAPVLLASAIQQAFLIAFVVIRRSDPGASAVDTLGWLFALCVPAVALGFLAGLVRWRLYVAGALQRLTLAMRQDAGPRNLQGTLAHALSDPSLQIALRRDGGWVDATGHPRDQPTPGVRQALTEVRDEHEVVAALVHDSALAEDREFASAVATCALTAVEHQRLAATVNAGLGELDGLRAQLLADVDDERRRIERDLHDGVQQRLVVLGIRLALAREQLAVNREAGSAMLQPLGAEVEAILEEIRSLARGVYPSLLVDRGLPDALRAVALRAPMPAEVDAPDVARYPAEIEAAVYFTCLEALQNAVKHARATRVSIALGDNGALTFDVYDDGAGFAEDSVNPGSGLSNMRDRLAEVGGTLTIQSAPGRGTRVSGTVPPG